MSLNKLPQDLVESDLHVLVDNEVSEGKTIDYKQELPGNSRDDKKEFLADVSSFANASGGYLIFGMKEQGGIATELCGLEIVNADAEILRLDNILRDGLKPRVPGISIGSVSLGNSRVAIVIHIPRSWAQPHVVDFQRHWRFYSRNSAGKYPLDVAEVKAAFTLSETISERMRLFRTERLGNIVAGQTPIMLEDGAKTVLHLVPMGAFDPAAVFDLSSLDWRELRPLHSAGMDYRHNFDGLVTYTQRLGETSSAMTYLQLFRNGIIEAVETTLLQTRNRDGISFIPSQAYEQERLEKIPRFLKIQKQLGVSPPIFIMLSLMGVQGYKMGVRDEWRYGRSEERVIDRTDLIIPEIMVEEIGHTVDTIDQVMQSAFDVIWNAAGWSRSMNYDNEGKWNPTR